MPTLLDMPQVIKAIYDEPNNRIRVDAGATFNISGELEVAIDAASGDNIAISDGVNTLDVNPDQSINVHVLNELVTESFDTVQVTVQTVNGPGTVLYKTGGLAGTTQATLNIVYDINGDFQSVVKT